MVYSVFGYSSVINFFAILPTGNATIDELVTQLMHCVEVFQHQQQTDIAEEVGDE